MKKYHQLTQEERYIINAMRVGKCSQAEIARCLGRSRSTICRELKRNLTTNRGQYRPEQAHSYATARRRRCRRGPHFSALQMVKVAQMIRKKFSPEQIVGTLKRFGDFRISTETIYRWLRRDKKLGGSLCKHTRIMSKYGRKRYKGQDSRGVLAGKRHISERPAEVELRSTLGHWEGDTVVGSDMRHCTLTLVERASGFGIIKKLKARTKDEVTQAAMLAITEHQHMFQTISLDNGTEFHDYAKLEQRFDIKCYFATPYHSWERGSNENFNGLLRQYLPKGTCMRSLTQQQCDVIANELNDRPRKRHNFLSPAEIYFRRHSVALAR
jgi:IS30 family transposase